MNSSLRKTSEFKLKKRLINIFKKDFEIINCYGINFYNKKVIPDIIMKSLNSDFLIVIELKDDTFKNYKISDLISQAISYKYATYNGLFPSLTLISTYSFLKGGSVRTIKELELMFKLGVGILNFNNDTGKLQFRIGGKIFYNYNPITKESTFDFNIIPSINIGTKAKSNKIHLVDLI